MGILVASDALELVEGGLAPEAVGFCGDRPMLAVAVDDDPMLGTLSQIAPSLPCVTVGIARAGADLPSPPDFDILLTDEESAPQPWVGCPDLDAVLGRLTAAVEDGPEAAIALA
jgi:hypothetical protein